MRLQLVDVIEVEPVLEVVLDEVLRFCVDLLVREGDIERVGDTLSLEGQPPAVALPCSRNRIKKCIFRDQTTYLAREIE